MKTYCAIIIAILSLLCTGLRASHYPTGFFLSDSIGSVTLTCKIVKDLIVLPVTINDSVNVNLILDTGCRNLVLFGKRFTRLFEFPPSRPVVFSGLGDGKPVTGKLALDNKVEIGHVLGNQIPIVIVDTAIPVTSHFRIDGIIGYDVFLRFEIEINPRERSITFRPAERSSVPAGFTIVPLRILDARPIVESNIYMHKGAPRSLELMIDTGSSLGLLLKTTKMQDFDDRRQEKLLGHGLNGPVSGYETSIL